MKPVLFVIYMIFYLCLQFLHFFILDQLSNVLDFEEQ